jgi:ABC-type Fe3+ transport system substrate-binding protein
MTGAAGMFLSAYPGQWLDPIPPVLIHPDARDGSKWPNGKLWFVDPEEERILRFASQVSSGISINTNFVKEGEIKSWYDLLKPEYRGKIATDDPAAGGGGHGLATTLYWKLGEDFVKRLYLDQRPGITRDNRQLGDWLARGAYSIAFGLRDEELKELQENGFPVTVVGALAEMPQSVSAGSGMLGLMNNAPHPNGAKLFVNWAMTREGMQVITKYGGLAGVRTDVDKSHMWPPLVMVPGREYIDQSDWSFSINDRLPLSTRVKELLRDGG